VFLIAVGVMGYVQLQNIKAFNERSKILRAISEEIKAERRKR
jgi:hypothetical protein